MFSLSPTLDIGRIPRRPHNASQLELEGWRFLPLRREWDPAEKDDLLAATGLGTISNSHVKYSSRRWWVAFLDGFLIHREPIRAAVDASIAQG